ncbi:MAG: HAD-IA family hydrolase [bacterium]|nr:HAD-IA family hydrolase [bacterium]
MNKKSGNNIKAVVFDFGGVIELYEGGTMLSAIAQYLGVSAADFRSVYFQHNHLSNVKNLSWEDMILTVVSVFTKDKTKEDEVRKIIQDRASQRRVNTELLSFFPQLKKLGLKTGIFSNANSALRERLKELCLLELPDVLVLSGDIGHQKPHKEAFQVLFEKLGLKPEEVVFIDDTPRSLEKAGEIGYIPILFKNNEQLKADLGDLGIILS